MYKLSIFIEIKSITVLQIIIDWSSYKQSSVYPHILTTCKIETKKHASSHFIVNRIKIDPVHWWFMQTDTYANLDSWYKNGIFPFLGHAINFQ